MFRIVQDLNLTKMTQLADVALPLHEQPGGDFPLQLITGRMLYHFHTRTKTARAPQLQRAAPRSGWSSAPPTRTRWGSARAI